MREAEVESDIAAQRQPAYVCLRNAEAAQQVVEVLDEVLLRVRIRLLEHARGRVAAMVVGDDPVTAGEVAHLGLPRAIVAAELVAPHERKATAGLFVIDIDAVDVLDAHLGTEERHGPAGALPSVGGHGGPFEVPHYYRWVRRSWGGGDSRRRRRARMSRASVRPPRPKARATAKTRPPKLM